VSEVGSFTAAPAPATPVALPSRVDIPAEGFAETRAVAAKVAVPAARRIRHTVQRGDTLYSLAARYGTTIDAIIAENRLRSPRSLRAGQTLTLTLAVLN
jgi:LysM repeat protein